MTLLVPHLGARSHESQARRRTNPPRLRFDGEEAALTRHVIRDNSGAETSEVRTSKTRLFGILVLCANLALVPLVFDQSFDVPFTVTKVLLSHALAYVLGGVILGLLFRHGRAFFVWSWLHIPVLAFLGANMVAAAFAADRVLALYGTHARMLGLGTIADYVVLYFAVVLLVRTRTEAIVAAAFVVAASTFVLGYEAVQLAGLDPLTWNLESKLRPFSTIGQSTSLAHYLVILGFGALALGLLARRLAFPVRGLAVAYSGVLFVAAIATGTRSGLIGFATGSALLIFLTWMLHPSRHARLVTGILAVAAVVVGAGVLILTPLGGRVTSIVEPVTPENANADFLGRLEPSAAGRAELYGTAFQMLRDRPLFGYGPDNFAVGVPKYRPERAIFREGVATSPHSWLTQVATGSGLLGVGTFLGIPLLAMALTLRSRFDPVAIAGLTMMAAFLGTGITTINDVVGDSLFWASAGMVAVATASSATMRSSQGPDHARRRTAQGGTPSASRSRRLVPRTFVAAGLVLSLTTFGALNASRSAQLSQVARLSGRATESVAFGVQATGSDSGRPEYWDVLGLAYVGGSRWAQASAAFERAANLAPYDVRYASDLIQVQLILLTNGDPSALTRASRLADEVVRRDPNNPRAHIVRAVVMQAAGDLTEADASAQRALVLDPGSTSPPIYVVAAQVALALGRTDDAMQIARRGLSALGPTPESVPVLVEFARALLAADRRSEALAELDEALSIQPNALDAQRLRAEILAGQK